MQAQADDVLHFWFKELTPAQHFTADPAVDGDIAQRFAAAWEAARRCELWTWRATPRGRLRISAPITFGSHALAPELPDYLKRHPEISLDLSLTNRTVDLVEEGFDVVFRTGDLPDSGLLLHRHYAA